MDKDIGKVQKNENTEIVIRIDDFGGKRGLTIREFVTGERYTGFTKSGTRITDSEFQKFKLLINSISDSDMKDDSADTSSQKKLPPKEQDQSAEFEDY